MGCRGCLARQSVSSLSASSSRGCSEMWSIFFFSSRRWHTRCLSDWSSDVYSSDLGHTTRPARRPGKVFWQDESYDHWVRDEADSRIARCVEDAMARGEKTLAQYLLHAYVVMRSEERRVGKESR